MRGILACKNGPTSTVFVAPMTDILIRDCWLILRDKLKFPDLYANKGIYWFNFRLNWIAFLIFFRYCLSYLPYVYRFLSVSSDSYLHNLGGFITAINPKPIAKAGTACSTPHFFGYFAAIVLYYLLNSVITNILGIWEDVLEGNVEGIPVVVEVSAGRDQTGEEWCQRQWEGKFCEV